MAARMGIEIRGAESERHVELGGFQELQDGFDDANDGVILAIQLHLLPRYLRVGAEAGFPEIRSQHDDVVMAGLLLIRREEAAEKQAAPRASETGSRWHGGRKRAAGPDRR